MSRRHVPLALAGIALVLALLLTLAAREVRLWQDSVAAGDERFQISPGPRDLWKPDAWMIGGDTVPSLLGLDDDLRLREAARLFRRSKPRAVTARTPTELSFATAAQVAFAQVQQSDAPRLLRSIAANELGVLAFAELLTDPAQARDHVRRASQKFTEALRLDPRNEAARHNLELILTLVHGAESRLRLGLVIEGGGSTGGAGSSQGGSGF